MNESWGVFPILILSEQVWINGDSEEVKQNMFNGSLQLCCVRMVALKPGQGWNFRI